MHANTSLTASPLPPAYASRRAYKFSFIVCSLCLLPSIRLAALHACLGDWPKTRLAALRENIVQARTFNSRVRVTSELILRLAMLDDTELRLFAASQAGEQRYLLWLALCRRYAFIADFARETLYENFLCRGRAVTFDDYRVLFNNKAQWHHEFNRLADSTRRKLRPSLFQIMREAGIIDANNIIQPVGGMSSFRRYLAQLPEPEPLFFPGLTQT